MNSDLDQFFIKNNYPLPKNITQDGAIHRFGCGKKYWYIAFESWIIIGDWSNELPKIDEPINKNEFDLLSDGEKKILQDKIRTAKAEQEKEKKLAQEKASKEALKIWESLSKTGNSKYLANKSLQPVTGVRFGNNNKGDFIATALIDNFGKISSLQFIHDDGLKIFLEGGKVKGCYSIFGNKEAQKVFICEGLATGLSILLAKPDCLVVIAYDCHNLKKVASNILAKYPSQEIIIAGDNDISKTKNAGKEATLATAQELNLKYVLPNFEDFGKSAHNLSDFDDLRNLAGIEEVKKQLEINLKSEYCKISNLKVLTVRDFLSINLPEREYIIEPILPKQGLMMIYASRGIGKTYFALQLACSMAGGKSLFNNRWQVNKEWKVLYIDGEMPANTMQQRLSSIIANLDQEKVNGNLSILTRDLQNGIMPNLASVDGQKEIEPYIKDIDVIIVDNLSTLCSYGKENESNSWNPIQEWALNLRSKVKSIIFVHHAGKNNDQRGTSKKEDILDTSINLKRPQDYENNQGARFEVHFEKSRGFAGEKANPFELRLDIVDGKTTWQSNEIEDLQMKQVIELSKLGMNHREIANEMDISDSKAYRILKKYKEGK